MEVGTEMRSKREDEAVGGVEECMEYLLDRIFPELWDGHIPLETLMLGGVP